MTLLWLTGGSGVSVALPAPAADLLLLPSVSRTPLSLDNNEALHIIGGISMR